MKKTIRQSIVLFLFLSGVVFSGPPSRAGGPDLQLEQKLFALIENMREAKFRVISVKEVEELIGETCQIKKRGGLIFGNEFESFSYDLLSADSSGGSYCVELLTKGREADMSKRLVITARIIFTSPAGATYYNYLIPESWPSRSLRTEPKT